MLSLKSPLGLLTVLVFHLLQTHSSNGQSQLIGSSQPIVAAVGDDIILPCHLEPAEDVTAKILEWTRPDLKPSYVHVVRSGQDLVETKHPSYKDRTSLVIEELKHGNISLKLSKVKLSDKGTYKCYIHENRQSSVNLVVVSDAVSSAFISLAGIDRDRKGVVLQCESKGWYPEPEVFWLDGERNLLSAGPTETIRGPDYLYTVSSRVTVEKRHSNNFTCKVQQTNINQTRETHIIVPDDFFPVPDLPGSTSSSSVPNIIGVIVGIIFILSVVLVVWKWRQNKLKNKKNNEDEETQIMREKSNSTSNDPEQESLIKTEREREMMKNEDKKMNPLSEETKLQCETEKETPQRETNNVLVQTQKGPLQQSGSGEANLPVPVKQETDQLLKEGKIKTGLDKREEETEPTSKGAESTGSAETCQKQSEQQSINNDGEGQPVGIIAGDVKKNESLIKAEKEREMMKNEDKKMNSLSEETKLQCETEKETHQRETNNVLVQTQEGPLQQSGSEKANLPVPVKEGEIKTGLDKREEETEPTSKGAESIGSAETCPKQSDQQSINNDGKGQPVGIIAGEVKKNEEHEEKKTQSTTKAKKEKEIEMDKEREKLLKQLQTKEREEKKIKENISRYNRNIKVHEEKINQLNEKDDTETQKVAAAEDKNDLEKKKADFQKALQRNQSDLHTATEKIMKITNEKKEIMEKLKEIQIDSDEDL